MVDVTISELNSEEEWMAAYPVMSQLRTDLDEETYVDRLNVMCDNGYRLFALSVDGEIVSLAGVSIQTNLHDGRYAWVFDLVTDTAHRSRGFGARLLSHIETWARDNGTAVLALASGLQREEAHRFYEEYGMESTSYIFKRRIM